MSHCKRMTLAQFGRLATPEEDALDVARTALLLEDFKVKETRLAALKAKLDALLVRRYTAAARTVRELRQDTTEAITLLDGDFIVTADLPQEVFWDQKKLAKLAETIFHDWLRDPEDYIKISYVIEERTYLSWPAELREQFDAARTLGVGKPSFTITHVEREKPQASAAKTRLA